MNRGDDPGMTLSRLAHDGSDAAAPAQAMPAESTVPLGMPSVGRLSGFDEAGLGLLVGLGSDHPQPVAARSTVVLGRDDVGHDVLVLFENNDRRFPIVVGVMQSPPQRDVEVARPDAGPTVLADGERQVIQASRELVLRCGAASITMTHSGKVIIRGSYILSRSTGYNKLKGAAIDIN